jgi:hypothetical protein
MQLTDDRGVGGNRRVVLALIPLPHLSMGLAAVLFFAVGAVAPFSLATF